MKRSVLCMQKQELNYKLVIPQSFYGNEINDILKYYNIKNVDSFLKPTLDPNVVEDPLLFDNINEACNVILDGVKNKKKFAIIIDCDADGFTSSSVMYRYLKQLNSEVEITPYFHEKKVHGLQEHYKQIGETDCDIVLVPDAGSSDIDEAKYLYNLNKQVLVLDHHLVDEDIYTSSPAIIVNNQASKRVTDKSLTGVGVVYKLCKLLDTKLGLNYADDYLPYLAIGQIADRADLCNSPQSRYLVFKALTTMYKRECKSSFINMLLDAQSYSMNNKVNMTTVAFYICPLINSLIRLGTMEQKENMFKAMCDSKDTIERKIRGKGIVNITVQEYAIKDCQSLHRKQSKLIEEECILLYEQIAHCQLDKLPMLIVNGDSVDPSMTGLIANKLVSTYRKPTFLLRKKGNTLAGSGRNFDKFAIVDLKKWCDDTGLFKLAQGHANAFGVMIDSNNINKLFEVISQVKADAYVHSVFGEYNASSLSGEIVKNIGSYDYVWGAGINPPLFVVKGMTMNKYNINLKGSKQNIIEFQYKNIIVTKMARYSLEEEYNDIIRTATKQGNDNVEFDMVCTFNIDYKNDKAPKLCIEDWVFRPSTKLQYNPFGFN